MQSKTESLVEVCINVLIGWVLAIVTQLIVFPWFDIHITMADQLWISAVFTAVSIARGYVIRRWFNARLKSAVVSIARSIDK
jgi:hypothetical protein